MFGDEVLADVIERIGSEMVRLAFEMRGKIKPPATYYADVSQ
jgi:hypothetical protein